MLYRTLLLKNPDQAPAGSPLSGSLSSPARTQFNLQRSAYSDHRSSWWILRRGLPGSPDSFAISLVDLVFPAHLLRFFSVWLALIIIGSRILAINFLNRLLFSECSSACGLSRPLKR
ncbi:hypothetical protein CRENBAI_018503 [Crenichthys baileyi]|uniref:Uncharacterized protein n=1 Tax=Crenichthys baileyi TaxID=28760 RepID=A0AAV9RZL0_9TELE